MAIATFDDVRRQARYDSDDRAKLAKSMGGKNLFLSHSLSDLQHAKYAVDVLEQNGARVYIDVADAAIASSTSRDVAARLRTAIRECRRLVVLVTENTRTSRWIPWEMGIADAISGGERVALLPLKATASASDLWAQQEYFDLYARVECLHTDGGRMWIVRPPDGSGPYLLSHWIERTQAR